MVLAVVAAYVNVSCRRSCFKYWKQPNLVIERISYRLNNHERMLERMGGGGVRVEINEGRNKNCAI